MFVRPNIPSNIVFHDSYQDKLQSVLKANQNTNVSNKDYILFVNYPTQDIHSDSNFWTDLINDLSNVKENRMGAGIAKTIKEKYPEMYKADTVKYKSIEDQKERTGYDDDKVSHLGDLSCHKFGELKYGFNLYTQVHYFYKFGQKPFRSDALKSAMLKMHNMIKQINSDNKQISVGFPRIGSGLALGDEKEIQQMIFDEFKNSPNIKVYIYDFKP